MCRRFAGILPDLRTLVLLTLSSFLLPATVLAVPGAAPPSSPKVFVYPGKLTSRDRLFDGSTRIEITGETTLVWVDLMPEARFEHPTEYLLISAAGTRIIRGDWWPTLNGKDLFRGVNPTRS